MHSLSSRTLLLAGFLVFGLASAACGGSKKPAEVPKSETAEAPRAGSTTPDPATSDADKNVSAPAAAPASASADNGSDIIPPFPSAGAGKEKDSTAAAGAAEKDPPAKKKGGRGSGAKKHGGKSRKKG